MSLKKGVVTVAPKRQDYAIDFAQLRRLVSEGGATLHGIAEATVVGTVAHEKDGAWLTVQGSGQRLRIANPDALAELAAKHPDAPLEVAGGIAEETAEGRGKGELPALALRVERAGPAKTGAGEKKRD